MIIYYVNYLRMWYQQKKKQSKIEVPWISFKIYEFSLNEEKQKLTKDIS